ncbi:MAG: TetR/AcrR family transcriptional regulator [Clostridiales bacterium]|nr:TetR/AcrR family transcriptional regulator [Clostridiales bacterium]
MDYSQRRREQAKRTEQAILRAAVELLRRNQFDKVSVRDICREAGITTGAFYHHFKSKEEMLLRGFAPLDTYMEERLEEHRDEPPGRRLWFILSGYAAFMENMGWELVGRYYQQRLNRPDSRSIDSSRFTLRSIRECLMEAEQSGELPGGLAAEWVADFLFRHFRGVVIDWILHQGSYPLYPKLEQDYLFFQGVFQGEEEERKN